ncbi:hypothetical protein ANANG_G00205770 [Anguilla anguilla]|uniref:Uncharacterized protein n=1 Tax=Anguilla anguilla TaxID=7936 RepID=A0A9D3M678_ANGAN|nr:hypothetical protein ANANG_G00205770 [Anguilla anguilla]
MRQLLANLVQSAERVEERRECPGRFGTTPEPTHSTVVYVICSSGLPRGPKTHGRASEPTSENAPSAGRDCWLGLLLTVSYERTVKRCYHLCARFDTD